MSSALRIFLCDDVPELRALLRYGLEEDEDLQVVGEAGDALAGIEGVSDLQPDVVLLDLSMPGMDGLEAIPRLRAVAPASSIVVFSGSPPSACATRRWSSGPSATSRRASRWNRIRALVRELAGRG